jgi:DNA ligase (NAD+)
MGTTMASLPNSASTIGFNTVFLVERKFDGISAELRYVNGELAMALTRGDGNSGEDMTAQVRVLNSVPSKLTIPESYLNMPQVTNLHVRGELVMSKSELERINKEVVAQGGKPYMSTRNLTAGTMKQKDLSIVASRDIQFKPWDVYSPDQDNELPDSAYRRMLMLPSFGFDKYEGKLVINDSFVLPALEEILEQNEKSDIIADGVVIKVDSHQLRSSLGVSSNTTNYQVCFKPQNAGAETILKEVIWSNGRTGKLTPVAICEPVVLAGAVVTRANLNNITWINSLGLTLGAKVKILRSGDVIPIITAAVTKTDQPILPPTVCPDCGHAVIESESDAKVVTHECGNSSCPGTLAHHLYAVADRETLEIDALGPELADQLVSRGYVRNMSDLVCFADDVFASIQKHGDDKVAANLHNKIGFTSGVAVVKMAKSVQTAKNAGWNRWIAALGIPMIGHSLGKTLANVLKLDADAMGTLCDKFLALPAGTEGFGPRKMASLTTWASDQGNKDLVKNLFEAGVRPKSQMVRDTTGMPLDGMTFCITGDLAQPREMVEKKLESLGATKKSGVSKKTNVLIIGNAPGANKQKDAAKHGVRTVGEDWVRATFLKHNISYEATTPVFEVEDVVD